MVEPVDPCQRRQLHGFSRFPRRTAMDQFRLLQAINPLCQRVIVAIGPATDGRFDACFRQSFGVPDRDLL